MTFTREDGSAQVAELPGGRYEKLSPGPGMSAAQVDDHQKARIHSAMVEAVGEVGYDSVTVRKLVGLSGVSTRAFYQHYSNKEECFLRTHELLVRRIVRRVFAVQAGKPMGRVHLLAVVSTFVDELERDPSGARLLLVDSYAISQQARQQAMRAERSFELRFAEDLASDDGRDISPAILKGIVSGVFSVCRTWVLSGSAAVNLAEELTRWMLAVAHCAYSPSLAIIPSARLGPVKPTLGDQAAEGPSGNRALLIAAMAKVVAVHGFCELTEQRICRSAGVSRATFRSEFDSIGKCLVATVERYVADAVDDTLGHPDGTLALRQLCGRMDGNGTLAALCAVKSATVNGLSDEEHERLTAMVARLLMPSAEAGAPRPVAVDASAGAIWALLGRRAAEKANSETIPAFRAFAQAIRVSRLCAVQPPNGTSSSKQESINKSYSG